MLNQLRDIFSGNFIAHGSCYLWNPALVWLHASSDFLISLSYYSIPLLLLYFVRRRHDVPFQGIFILFSASILSCGTSHLLEIWTLWHPDYWLSGLSKAVTAVVSSYTAAKMVPLLPKALALPGSSQLAVANLALAREVAEYKQTVAALQQANEELEQQVERRTSELSRAYEALQVEICDRQSVEFALAERDRYLAAFVEMQHQLLALKPEENYYASIVERLGQWSRASQINIFEICGDKRSQLLCQCAEWVAPERSGDNHHPRRSFPYDEYFPRWMPILAQGQTLMGLASEFPHQERLILERMGILSLLVLPLTVSDRFFGFIVFENCSEARVWSASAVDLFKATVASLSLQHERAIAQGAVRRSEAQLKAQSTELEQTVYQLKQAQAQLMQSEKMSSLGMMVAGIAHEINNPVGFVYGNLTPAEEYIQDLLGLINLYRQHYPVPVPAIQAYTEDIDLDFLMEDLPNLLDSMKVGAERIRDIVTTLRTFSRVDEAKMKPVNIHEGIDSTLVILHHRLKEKHGRLPVEVVKKYGNLPPVEGYAGQLNQVFMNILVNAIDALDSKRLRESCANSESISSRICPPPRIEIRTELIHSGESNSESKNVVIRIIDNGSGITEWVRLRLFDPFFTTKPVGQGTGLGLSISYQIVVAKHGGQLQCRSVPGEGTEFIIQLPVLQQTQQQHRDSTQTIPKGVEPTQPLYQYLETSVENRYPIHPIAHH
ncbi:MAG TPA: ATP-binding protein [Allocoleopsis sp.]